MNNKILSILILLSLVALMFAPNIPAANGHGLQPSYLKEAFSVADRIKPIVNEEWLAFFIWARSETPPSTIFASWWDFGHPFTALAKRSIVADGNQNNLHVHDLGRFFTSQNESEAIEILREYNVGYVFTYSEMLNKYKAISYATNKQEEYYVDVPMLAYADDPTERIYRYQLSSVEEILVFRPYKTTDIRVELWQSGKNKTVCRVQYFIPNGTEHLSIIAESPDENCIDGRLYIEHDYDGIVWMTPKIENSMLTRLHVGNAEELEQFELVEKFGTISLFRVLY